jgi:hypothetical protein
MRLEELKDIEPYAYEVIYPDGDGELFYMQHLAKERAVEVEGLVRGLHTPKQMQEYAEAMVYEALYKHTNFGTGKEELVRHMTNIFFQEKALQEVK